MPNCSRAHVRLKTKFEDLVWFFEDYYAIDAHSTIFVKQVGDYVLNTIHDIFSKGPKVPKVYFQMEKVITKLECASSSWAFDHMGIFCKFFM